MSKMLRRLESWDFNPVMHGALLRLRFRRCSDWVDWQARYTEFLRGAVRASVWLFRVRSLGRFEAASGQMAQAGSTRQGRSVIVAYPSDPARDPEQCVLVEGSSQTRFSEFMTRRRHVNDRAAGKEVERIYQARS